MLSQAVSRAAAMTDTMATRAGALGVARASKRSSPESLSHEQRVQKLLHVAERYAGQDHSFFRPARAITPKENSVLSQVRLDGGRTVDLSWPSRYELFIPELAERYLRIAQNETAHARMLAHKQPASVIVLIHGYLAGQYLVEQRLWASSTLYRRGYDVVHFTLPFHGVRGDSRRTFPPFPNGDPRITIEGFRQAMGDLQDLIEWLRSRGHPDIGVMGMSLGGYTASLLATLEQRLAFAVPVIPLACIADFAHAQGRLGKTPEEARIERTALEDAYSIVSPLRRKPSLPSDRIRVIAGRGDRITPVSHAEKLATHFNTDVRLWPGGHVLQFGRLAAYREVVLDLEQTTGFCPNGKRLIQAP